MYDCNQVTGYCELQYDFCFLLFNIEGMWYKLITAPCLYQCLEKGSIIISLYIKRVENSTGNFFLLLLLAQLKSFTMVL